MTMLCILRTPRLSHLPVSAMRLTVIILLARILSFPCFLDDFIFHRLNSSTDAFSIVSVSTTHQHYKHHDWHCYPRTKSKRIISFHHYNSNHQSICSKLSLRTQKVGDLEEKEEIVSSQPGTSNTNSNNPKNHNHHIVTISDDKPSYYPQQTPHSGRHFLPSHPFFSKSEPRIKTIFQKINNRLSKLPQRIIYNKRFFEGWYYRITLPQNNTSFAFIVSIDDPGRQLSIPCNDHDDYQQDYNTYTQNDDFKLAAIQIMGPNDEYMIQSDRNNTKFWAWENGQGLGCTFDYKKQQYQSVVVPNITTSTTAMHPTTWRQVVQTGFQVLPTHLQGRVSGHDSINGLSPNTRGNQHKSCEFDFSIQPKSGYGSDFNSQKSTAGWLASYAVFDPHWQVTIADGRASGFIKWYNYTTTDFSQDATSQEKQQHGQYLFYNFTNAPFYAEKNWGSAFPIKWYWAQCNAFNNSQNGEPYQRLSVTAGGGTRTLPSLLPQQQRRRRKDKLSKVRTEDLGMVTVHYDGVFYEAVPWTGEMEWDVTWGRWYFVARCTSSKFQTKLKRKIVNLYQRRKSEKQRLNVQGQSITVDYEPTLFEIEMEAICDPNRIPGCQLRAPTKEKGLSYSCKDSFQAEVSLSIYHLCYDTKLKKYTRDMTKAPILDRAISNQCAVEIGGVKWPDWGEKEDGRQGGEGTGRWRGKSKMKQPLKALVQLPYFLRGKM